MSRRGPSFNPNPPTPVGTETDRIDPNPANEEEAGKVYEPSNVTIDKFQIDVNKPTKFVKSGQW